VPAEPHIPSQAREDRKFAEQAAHVPHHTYNPHSTGYHSAPVHREEAAVPKSHLETHRVTHVMPDNSAHVDKEVHRVYEEKARVFDVNEVPAEPHIPSQAREDRKFAEQAAHVPHHTYNPHSTGYHSAPVHREEAAVPNSHLETHRVTHVMPDNSAHVDKEVHRVYDQKPPVFDVNEVPAEPHIPSQQRQDRQFAQEAAHVPHHTYNNPHASAPVHSHQAPAQPVGGSSHLETHRVTHVMPDNSAHVDKEVHRVYDQKPPVFDVNEVPAEPHIPSQQRQDRQFAERAAHVPHHTYNGVPVQEEPRRVQIDANEGFVSHSAPASDSVPHGNVHEFHHLHTDQNIERPHMDTPPASNPPGDLYQSIPNPHDRHTNPIN